jgi:biotin carboxyl carrier protein
MYQIKVNGKEARDVAADAEGVVIDGKKTDWDMRRLPDGTYHILAEGKSYHAILEHLDPDQKRMTLRINNNTYQLDIREPIDLLLQKMGLNVAADRKAEPIKAPMPGLVLKVLVAEGQNLKKGDPVLILEAMKMENVFKAPADAMVKAVKIKEGQAVEKGMVLIELH